MSTRQRVLIVALIVSMTVNLLLVGGIVGKLVWGGPPPRPVPEHVGWIVRRLDDDRRQELRDDVIAHIRSSRSMRQSMRDAQKHFEATITAEDFDPERVRDALAALREAHTAWQTASHEQMVTVLSRLSPEERKRVATYLERRDRRSDRPGDGGRHDGQ